jgi:predicted phage-related endonuclease
MSAVTAHEAFLIQRRAYLGGTDIAGIIGVSPWSSPLSVYVDKTAPEQAEDKDSLPMRRGLALERFIADEFVRARPGIVTYHPSPIVRTDWGFPAGASIDYMVARVEHPRTPVGLMDSKTAMSFYSRRQWKEPDPDRGLQEGDLPDAYYTQLQWYLAVSGLSHAWAAADTGDDSLTVVPVTPSPSIQARLIDAGREFWTQHVERGIAPEPSGTDADADALSRMWPDTIPDPPVTIEDELAEVILSDYLAHKFKAEEAKRAADADKQRLQALMGEHETAVIGRWKLAWKRQSRTTVDTKRLKAEKPDLAAEYAKTSESRVFAAPKEIDQ